MNILAIDPGTNCGWAIRYGNGDYVSGVWHLKPNRKEFKGEGVGARYLRLRRELVDLKFGDKEGDQVCFEEVRRHMGTDAAHIYGGIVAILTSWCELHNIAYTGIPVGTIKKHATSKGNADKDMMIAAAKAKWPNHEFEDDNEADARWIAETYLKLNPNE